MAKITIASGSVSVLMSDDLHQYVDMMLDQAVPSLRPAMERLIGEAVREVKDKWPDESDRRKFESDKARAVARAKSERARLRKQGRRIKGISFWDYMPDQYPPPGYRSSGRTKAGWKMEIRLEPGPVLSAVMLNDTTKAGAKYAYMAKLPPPSSNKTYLKTIAIPAIKSREDELVRRMLDDLGRMAGAE